MDNTNLRKAAILINALDARSADALLEQMSDERAALIRSAVMSLDDVDPAEQRAVMEEFVRQSNGSEPDIDHGVELDPSLAAKLKSAQDEAGNRSTDSSEQNDTPSDGPQSPPFSFLQDQETPTILATLREEPPQVLAVVLAHLPPSRAADLLARFEREVQVEILRRVAQLAEMDREIVREVERGLMVRVTAQQADARQAGLRAVRAILDAAHRQGQGELLDDLRERVPGLADRLEAAPAPAPSFAAGSAPFATTSLVAESRANESARPEAQAASSRIRPPDTAPPPPSGASADPPQAAADASHPLPPSPDAKAPEEANDPPAADDPPAAEEPPDANEPNRPAHAKPSDAAMKVPGPAANPISFDELGLLDDASLASVLRASPKQIALLALAGARRELVDRLLKQLPAAEAQRLNQRIEQVGPLRLTDIERAQRRIAEIAADLAERGVIQTTGLRRFAAAA